MMEDKTWLLLLYELPTAKNTERVNLWRKLKKFGALSLKTSAYLLPDSSLHYERFQWLSQQICDGGGDATLIRVAEIENLSREAVIALFGEARAADYDGLQVTVTELLKRKPKRPDETFQRDGPATAARLGAVAALVRSVGGVEYRLPHTGQTNFPPGVPKIPAAAVSAEDADLISALLREGPVAMRLVLTPQQLPDVVSHNVIADLKGSEHPEQVVIVSGHLDSWDLGTGAVDDAAGVGLAMQVANLLQQLHLRPRRTIRVIAWMNEENGQMGSKTYAAKRSAEMANHFAAMESDHGAGHPIGLFVNAKPETMPLLKPVAKVLQDSGAGVLEFNESTGTDIEPLAAAGIPTFCPLQDSRVYFD
jgi:peptidase M28-like protein/ChrB-like protein